MLLRAISLGRYGVDPDIKRLNSIQIYEICHLLVPIMPLAVSIQNVERLLILVWRECRALG